MLSYARFGEKPMSEAEFEAILHAARLERLVRIGRNPAGWNAPGTQAFFAEGPDFALLAFRGTEVADPVDSILDLNAVLMPEREYLGAAPKQLGGLAMLERVLSEPCKVHCGFQLGLDQVWDQVYGLLSGYRRAHPDGEICLTGHSLGGALALLTYARGMDKNTSVYTFGCPRVGNQAFAGRVAAHPGKGHFRFVNGDDLVAHVPPKTSFYCHAPGEHFRIGADGLVRVEIDDTLDRDLGVIGKVLQGLQLSGLHDLRRLDRVPAPPGLVDHSPARYCMRLWDCVERASAASG